MARPLHHGAAMSLPLAGGHSSPEDTPEAHVPELVPIEELTAQSIEMAEAEIEAEEAAPSGSGSGR